MKQGKSLTTGSSSAQVFNAIRESYNLNCVPRLTADWNLNRYVTPTADNIPAETDAGFDVEVFPIESIVEPLRPTKGIAKAIVNQALVSPGYQQPDEPKFYIADETDLYKYWVSPQTTDGVGNFPLHTDSETIARPYVTYPSVLQANKIVIKTENTWATVKNSTVHIRTTVGGAWSSAIITNPTVDNDGVLTLYWTGSAWSQTKPASMVATTAVAGIMFKVTSMQGGKKKDGSNTTYMKRSSTAALLSSNTTDGSNSSLAVISIEAHLEVNMTSRLMEVSDTFDMGDKSQIYPIGTITTNGANISLSNEDGLLNTENSSSQFYGLLEPNVKFTLEYIYDLTGTTYGNDTYSVQQFEMYCGEWMGQSSDVIQLDLEDYSKYLKESKPRKMMVQNKSVTEIIWRVLDSVGFNDYVIGEEDRLVEHTIPVFWTNGEDTVWEVLDELSQQTQTAIYMDSYGKLQVRTREAAFRDLDVADWNLRGTANGAALPDIIEWNTVEAFEANKVNVKYKSTVWKTARTGVPALSRVWETDQESIVVRSTQLISAITGTPTYFHIGKGDAAFWPYKSKVMIDGELIAYEGKQYIYYTGASGTTRNEAIVKDADEKKKYDDLTPYAWRYKNNFTGAMKITERGVWNTEQKDHSVDISGWVAKMEDNNVTKATSRGVIHNKAQSTLTLNTPPNMKSMKDTLWAVRGTVPSTGYKVQGTKMRFNSDAASRHQRGGMGFYLQGGGNEEGYYVELALTNMFNGKDRKTRSEVMIYSRKGNEWRLIKKGSPTAIARKIWYEVDVYISNGTQDTITVWINGKKVAQGTTTANTKQTQTGRIGMYARGKSNISFEYIYGINRTGTKVPPDDFSFYDLKYGGMRGGLWEREYVWETKTRWKKLRKKRKVKETYRWNQYLFDEFGPYVHEVREFEVPFDPAPVQYSTLFSTNQWYSAPLEYTSTPFGAKFIIANTGRDNAILHGEDSLIYGGKSRSVNQVLTVLGRNLEISDEETVLKENTESIRSRGPIETELSGDFIQSKNMAEGIGEWIAKHWSKGVDEVNVEIFGNPLIEIGDVVDVTYPHLNMTPATHMYFVVGTSTSFTTGVSTTLTLRRIRTAADSEITP